MTITSKEKYSKEALENYRESIDRLDTVLIYTLAERFTLTKKIGKLKAHNSLPPSDPERESNQVIRLEKLSREAGLDPKFAKELLKFIISEVIRHHEKFQE